MAQDIQLAYSNTNALTPSAALAGGEVAINTLNRKIWVGNGTSNALVFNHADYAPASANASQSYVTTQINSLVDAAPGALNTLNELAAAIGDDSNYASTITTALAGKYSTSNPAGYITGVTNISGNAGTATNATNATEAYHLDIADTRTAVITPNGYDDHRMSLDFSDDITTGWHSGITMKGWADGYAAWQLWGGSTTDTHENLYFRSGIATTWNSLRTILHSGNKYSQVTLAGLGFTGASNANYITNNSSLTNGAGYITSYVNTTYSEGDHGLTQANFTDILRAKLNGIAASATNTSAPHYTSAIGTGDGKLTTKNFTAALKTKLDGIAASATNTAAPYYTSAIAEGDHGRTQANFTDILRTKLNGITTGANNYTFPYTVSASEGASTVVQRNGSGYLHASYFNGSGTFSTTGAASGMARFTGTNGSDTYGRCYNATAARLLLNVADGATNTATPYYTSAIAEGDHGRTQANFTDILRTKLNGIATSATNTAAPYYTSAIAEGDHGRTQANFTDVLRTKLNGIAAGAQVNTAHVTNNNQLTNGAGYITSYVNTTYSEGDHGLTQANFTDILRTKLNGIAASATNTAAPHYTSAIGTGDGKLTTKNFTAANQTKLNGIAASATNTAAPYYTSAIAEGDHGRTQANFTDVLRTKLNGITTGANNYTHPTGNGNTHIPVNGAAGQFLKYTSAGTAVWAYDNNGVFSITAGWGLTGGTITALGTFAHSSANGFKHIPSSGSSGQFLQYLSAGTAQWVSNPNTDTTTWNGLQNISALTALP